MPRSRNRPGHPHHNEAAVPAKQRVKGRTIWAILFGVFGLFIALMAAGSYMVIAIAALVSAAIGYFIGKKMEEEAGKKTWNRHDILCEWLWAFEKVKIWVLQ